MASMASMARAGMFKSPVGLVQLTFQHLIKQTLQVFNRIWVEADLMCHADWALCAAANFDCSLAITASAGTPSPVATVLSDCSQAATHKLGVNLSPGRLIAHRSPRATSEARLLSSHQRQLHGLAK